LALDIRAIFAAMAGSPALNIACYNFGSPAFWFRGNPLISSGGESYAIKVH
jgi:hypothetical protein